MQTFMPYPDFEKSAACLDYRRLGKQRLEAMQILRILRGEATSKAWANHPAVRMWRGNEAQLWSYAVIVCREWISRGYKDTILKQLYELYPAYAVDLQVDVKPVWFGDNRFHGSHRSNLLRKDKAFYSKYRWPEKNDLPYFWPVSPSRVGQRENKV